MGKVFREIFSNGGPNLSSMRVMSFEIVQVALAIALIAVVQGKLDVDTIGLVLGLVGTALTGKVMQKGKEGASLTKEVGS